jgi:chromosomal replication initiator protein
MIATAVGRQFGFRVAELKGPSRRQAVSRARAMAMYLARQMTSHSTAAIGRHFGGRDHTTVMHACQVTQQRLDTDPAVRQAAEQITRRLGGDGTDTPV